VIDDYYTDNISKLDWRHAKDFNRLWVTIIKPSIDKHLSHTALFLGYQSHEIKELWFQQYLSNGTHGWHIHGSNFTAVYYLELNEKSPVTELICPFSLNKKIVPSVKEGDILIFPSYVIHRAPKINNSIRKTIISFNVDFLNIDPLVLNKINSI
jgi:hypothetical protein